MPEVSFYQLPIVGEVQSLLLVVYILLSICSEHIEYTMSSLESSLSEGRYRRRRRRYESTTNHCVESSILQCTAAVIFPTLSTNIHTEVPSNRIYRTNRHRTRRKAIPMISSLVLTALIISIIAVNNCCFAFQSPAIIQSRIQHGLVS